MNFWTFLDRNSFGAVSVVFIAFLFTAIMVDDCTGNLRGKRCPDTNADAGVP